MAIRRLERHAKHQIYCIEGGDRVCGASTIAGINKPVDPLMGWAANLAKQGKDWRKERDKTADYGTIAHFLIDCYLAKDEPDLSEFSEEDIEIGNYAYEKFLRYWKKAKLKLVAHEIQLVSKALKYGGTLDLVAENQDGGLILYDWKSSRAVYESHLFQSVGYMKLWEEDHPKISRVCINRIGRGKTGEAEQYWIPPELIEKYWTCFQARLALYWADRALKG